MTVKTLTQKQAEMHCKIKENAEKLGLTKQKPILEPVLDGVADIEGYLSSNPKIMWLLKEPWGDSTPAGNIKNRLWSFSEYFGDIENETLKDEQMWQVIIQVNYAIRNGLNWNQLEYIEDNPDMRDELKKIAYINLSKMPGNTTSSDSHLKECYPLWKDILFEQIELYKPDIIIFGNTLPYFKEDLQITGEPLYKTTSGKWNAHTYKQEDNRILIDAYHPSRKGGEDGSHDYVTAVVKAVRKALS